MLQTVKILKHCSLIAALLVVPLLSACDQIRNQIAAAVQARTPQDTLAEVRQHLAEGKYAQAAEKAEPSAKKPGELQPSFAMAAAQAYARLGRTEDALSMLGVALQGGAAEPTSLINHPDFEAMRTDVRFLALVTHHGSRSPGPSAPAPQAVNSPASPSAPSPSPATVQVKASDSVSVEIGPGGVGARAGSVSVKLPP